MRETFRNQTLVFRTSIIRQGNTVRVSKLTEIVISLWLGIIMLEKELSNVTYNIWELLHNINLE